MSKLIQAIVDFFKKLFGKKNKPTEQPPVEPPYTGDRPCAENSEK
jgi:hypothetical protein